MNGPSSPFGPSAGRRGAPGALVAVAAAALVAVGCGCRSPVAREDWPGPTDDPLLRYGVWIESYGQPIASGAIIHSSEEHGTLILTAAHVLADDDGFLVPDRSVAVGIWAISHHEPLEGPWEVYTADVVAATAGPRPASVHAAEYEYESFLRALDVADGNDMAVLRLRTDRLFEAAPLYTGPPAAIAGKEAVLLGVVPAMYPHRKPATCHADEIVCSTADDDHRGSAAFVRGEVVGLHNWMARGPGPGKLQRFLRGAEATRFLFPGTPASTTR